MKQYNIHKVLIVLNPNAGKKRFLFFQKLLDKNLDKNISYKLIEWRLQGYDLHSTILQEIDNEKFDAVIAAGGDGTVNAIASALVGSSTPLYIIPLGSGNGLARQLNIPLCPAKAIKNISSAKTKAIDVGMLNNLYFFCTAGLGFDAHIGRLFDQTKRGFWSYCKVFLREFKRYQPKQYEIHIEGKQMETTSFVITFANATQYGNNAHIAPEAKIDDGKLHMVITQKFNLITLPLIVFRLFTQSVHRSRFIQTLTVESAKIITTENGFAHIDGEVIIVDKKTNIGIIRNGLLVLS